MAGKCFFIGHRDAPNRILPLLQAEIEYHIVEYGVKDFYVGHYGKFDSMAAQAVRIAKQSHAEVKLMLLLPYHPFDQPIEKPEGFDGTLYPEGMERVPKRFAIIKANQYMVSNSTHLIAYVNHHMGGSGRVLEYAQRLENRGKLHIKNLAIVEEK